MKIIARLFAFSMLVLMSSCAKEVKEEQKKLILLTNPKGWTAIKIETNAGNGWQDITNQRTPLEEDNLSYYHPDYTWWDDEGALKFPGDPKIIDYGKYSLIQNNTQILKDNGDLIDIIELKKDSMVLSYTKDNVVIKTTYTILP